MSKIKSTFVTAIVFLMLAIITLACSQLCKPAFVIIIGFMSSIGFAGCTIAFCRWLQKPSECEDNNLDVINFKATPHYDEDLSESYEMTYEQIKQELDGGEK